MCGTRPRSYLVSMEQRQLTHVKAREKSAVKLFATCQLCPVGGGWIVWFSFLSLNLVHFILSNAALSNPWNCLHVALFLGTFRMCFRRQMGFHFQQNYHDSCTTTTGLKFFNTTRSWTRCYNTCFQVLLHYLYLLQVKEFPCKSYIGKSFLVCCK